MPLMSSPIDGSPMREIERYGVKMDICPTSGGIWLDKGELEKIIMMIRQEALEEQSAAPTYAEAPRYESQPSAERPKRRKRESLFWKLVSRNRDRAGPHAFEGVSNTAQSRWRLDPIPSDWSRAYRPGPLRRHTAILDRGA